MYWYSKTEDSENIGYIYKYFEYVREWNTIRVSEKYVHTHNEFLEWYEKNKSL